MNDEHNPEFIDLPSALTENPKFGLRSNIDYVIGHYLLHRDPSSPFFFIQIGAFDGVSGDAIYAYVRRFGWQGILVEPQERYFSQLQQNYAGCRGLKFLKAAISSDRGTQTLYTLKDPEDPGLPTWAPQIASFSRENVLKHQTYIPDLETRIHAEVVDCITFADVLKQANFPHIDLIQIDVEGYDYRILQMIDLDQVRPSIIRFEHKHLSSADHNGAIHRLGNAGYRLLIETYDTVAYDVAG